MKRLTLKECNTYEDFIFNFRNKLISSTEIDASVYKKLKKLEDLEEELGVELIVIFKALRDGVFINDDGIIYKDYIKSIEYCSECWFFITKDEEIEIFFEDYGVTWAL